MSAYSMRFEASFCLLFLLYLVKPNIMTDGNRISIMKTYFITLPVPDCPDIIKLFQTMVK